MRTIATIVSKGVLKRCIPDSIPVRYIGNKSGGRGCSGFIEPHPSRIGMRCSLFGVMLGEQDGIRVRGMLRSGSAGRGEGQDDKQAENRRTKENHVRHCSHANLVGKRELGLPTR